MTAPVDRAADRTALRAHPLDGAMLFFQPATGLHVRVATPATASLRRVAPRVVAFGITNRCNLDCAFCSRDVRTPSRWTRSSAYAALRELEEAGVLEVAFGGGEPFVFPELLGLLQDLHVGTRLALNITTNGTRIDEATARALADIVGIVRLSIYADTPWRRAAAHLSAAGVRWGANVLADAPSLATLPALFDELHTLGAEDVSILRYVGPDAHRHLDEEGRRTLDGHLAASPLPARVSVCFGPQLHAPLLFSGADGTGDCGAGRDFLTVTADGHVQACSFQSASLPAPTGADMLRVWREAGPTLGGASPRLGCARAERGAPVPTDDLGGVRVWRTYSGNNSGECLMVARFDAVQDAAQYLADLLPGYVPETALPPEWHQILKAEAISSRGDRFAETPRELLAVGRSVIASGYGADDIFAPLRTLAWKRGAEVAPGGIHVHDPLHVVFAIEARGGGDADELLAALDRVVARRHGDRVFGAGPVGALGGNVPGTRGGSLRQDLDAIRALADGRPFTATVLPHSVDDPGLLTALQHHGEVLDVHRRLFVRFYGSPAAEGEAICFAAGLDQPPVRIASVLLIEPPFGKRLVVGASRKAAIVKLLSTPTCRVTAMLSPPTPPGRAKPVPLDGEALLVELRDLLRTMGRTKESVTHVPHSAYAGAELQVESEAPGVVMQAAATLAERRGLGLWLGIAEVGALTRVLQRLAEDLTELRRVGG